MLTCKRLREVLNYNPDTGIFVWKVQTGTRGKVGRIAGSLNYYGYNQIKIDRKLYCAHRLAWLYMTGIWPQNQIDHYNGKPADNKWINLREATNRINTENQRNPSMNNTSGYLGAYYDKSTSSHPWRALIGVDGKQKYLGHFATPEKAHDAYLKAKRILHKGCTI